MKKPFLSILTVASILILAAVFRFYGINWDQGYHLHPDERFLTMVGLEMKTPQSFSDYLNPATSTFNPINIGFDFFVYGAFPLIFAKILSPFFASTSYESFTLFGRTLSALVDIAVVFLIFKTILLFEKYYKLHRSIKYLGAGFYAISVLPIQLAHFFAVDTFLNFFLFASVFYILKFSLEKKLWGLLLSAIFLGLALASKVTAIFIVPLLILLLLPQINLQKLKKIFETKNISNILLLGILYGLTCYLTLRIADPYLFQTSNFFDLRPNTIFLQNLQTLKGLSDPNVWYPPSLQWLHKTPILFSLQNIIFFGLGLPLFIFVVIGMVVTINLYKRSMLLFILVWCLFFFIYQSTQAAKTMRYFIILYPFFAIFAALGFYTITKKLKPFIAFLLVIPLLIWPLAFMNIYTQDHSRVAASTFIYNNIPNGSIILSEHWDDGLPLHIPNGMKTFTIKEMPVFGQDNDEKWQQMNTLLGEGDYIILSSNRGWGSILAAPERYPRMTKFYEDLFADKLQYKKIATFTSYPSLEYLGIPLTFPDDHAEEAFTVFDHPKVMIFKKQPL